MAERSSSWFGRRKKKAAQQGDKVVVDGSEIRELVQDTEAFGMLVETKFRQLDAEGNGRLDVRDLRPAVEDIGAALGLPTHAEGASPDTDHVYDEVVSELTHGTDHVEVSRAEFQEALSDILLGVAAGLKRDPIVILRMDGEDLNDFVGSVRYEPEAAAIFSAVAGGGQGASLRQSLLTALQQLTVDHGMPPAADAWVVDNIIEPALKQLPADQLDQPASREGFLDQLKKLLGAVAERVKEEPVIVAHTEHTYDGSGIKRLLASKFEMDKLLASVWRGIPAEHKNNAAPKECLRGALDKMADAAGLPPSGAVAQVDSVVDEAIKKMAYPDDAKAVEEAKFKKLLTDILRAVMLQLNEKPVFVSTNTVLHEPLSNSEAVTPAPSE